jgi:hypothetical protein
MRESKFKVQISEAEVVVNVFRESEGIFLV